MAASNKINRVAVKIQPFWNNSPHLWFAQIDAQFEIASINNENTFILYEVEDVIREPEIENPYSYLKAVLVSRLCVSEETRSSDFFPKQLLVRCLHSFAAFCKSKAIYL